MDAAPIGRMDDDKDGTIDLVNDRFAFLTVGLRVTAKWPLKLNVFVDARSTTRRSGPQT
jgi:hypothetical protein